MTPDNPLCYQALERVQERKLGSLGRKRAILDQGLQDLEMSYQLADRSIYGLTNSDFMSMYKPLTRKIQVGGSVIVSQDI